LENGYRVSLDADTEDSQLVDVSSAPNPVPPRNIKDVHASPIQKSVSAQEAHRRGANPVSHLVFSFPNTPMHSHTTLDTVSDRTTYEVHQEQREGKGDEMNSGESTDYESGMDEPLQFPHVTSSVQVKLVLTLAKSDFVHLEHSRLRWILPPRDPSHSSTPLWRDEIVLRYPGRYHDSTVIFRYHFSHRCAHPAHSDFPERSYETTHMSAQKCRRMQYTDQFGRFRRLFLYPSR
jgi:hypothetical protein